MNDGMHTPQGLRPLLRLTRKALVRLLYPKLAEIEARLNHLEEHRPTESAAEWDNEAVARRLAALEDTVNDLVRQAGSPKAPPNST